MFDRILAALLAVILALAGIGSPEISEIDIRDFLSGDYTSVSDFICDNLALFSKEYNEGIEDEAERFEATYCEARIPVYVTSLDSFGLYLDFDGDNGYMIVIDDYSVIAFENKGELLYLKGLDLCYYSISDGFLYYDEEGNQVLYEPRPTLSEEEWEEYLLGKQYDGMDSSDGTIRYPDSYVQDKYGSKYTLYRSASLPNYQYKLQAEGSIYAHRENGKWYTEGNCSLASIYALMNYLQQKSKYSNLPKSSDITRYDPTNDSFYQKYANDSDYQIAILKPIPDLYLAIRQYAVDHFNYEVGDTNPFHITTIIEHVAEQYGYSTLSATHDVVWSYDSNVISEIDNRYPTIWNCANSSIYHSHTMVVTGYRQYRKTTRILGINFYDYANLMQVNDNWNQGARYFDFTDYVAFGSFIRVR